MASWWNGKLMKWQAYKMSSWWNGKSVKEHIDEMSSCQNKNLMKWQVGKMASWQNGKLASWQMAIWWDVKLTKWQENLKNSYLMKLQVGEMSNCLADEMTRWHNARWAKWHVAKMKKGFKMSSRWNVNSTKRLGTIYFGSRLLQHQIRESAQTGEIKTNGYSELYTIKPCIYCNSCLGVNKTRASTPISPRNPIAWKARPLNWTQGNNV